MVILSLAELDIPTLTRQWVSTVQPVFESILCDATTTYCNAYPTDCNLSSEYAK